MGGPGSYYGDGSMGRDFWTRACLRFATHLAGVGLLLGVHPHVRQQFVLGVERREFPGAVLQHSRIDCRHSVSLQSSDPKSTLDGIEESLVSVYGGSEAHP